MNKTDFIDGKAVSLWAASILRACGVPANSAGTAADVLLDANLTGVETHGISRLKTYVALLKSKSANPEPAVTYEDNVGMVVFDADRGLGQVVGNVAIARAVELARHRAVVAMSIRRIGHLGALGYFTAQAAEAGMVAVLLQNGPPIMGLAGMKRPAIGNNPLAFSAPVPGGPPLVFDIATSEAAYGKIIERARLGEAIPLGWALDSNGMPTVDAKQALTGSLLAAAGHKGIGLAMLVECLAGSLTGMTPRNVVPDGLSMPAYFGAFLLVINPELAIGKGVYEHHLADWILVYKNAGPQGRYPGERLAALRDERRETGIPIGPELCREMRALGTSLNLPFPL